MNNSYDDIKSLTKVKPYWYDDNGVPRYCEPHPDHLPNIYCNRAVFIRISCQSCGQKFIVSISQHNNLLDKVKVDLPFEIGWLDYGDPPIHNCVGDSMSSESIELISAWIRNKRTKYEWEQVELSPRQKLIKQWTEPTERKIGKNKND